MKCNVSLLMGLALGLPAVLSLPSSSDSALASRNLLTDFFSGLATASCGKDHGGKKCDPNGLFGGCCSRHGTCGSTPAHCLKGAGCQTGYGTCTSDKEADTQPEGAQQEPVLGNPATQTAKSTSPAVHKFMAAAASPTTTTGTCGATNGNTVCGNWPQGNCCSQYGYCGNTNAHCGYGCQSGNCQGNPVKVTTDGTCGANINTICGGFSKGTCCSQYGYCGEDSAHCGEGCQSGDCYGAPEIPAPKASPAPKNLNPGKLVINANTQAQGHSVGSGVPVMHTGLLPNGKVFFLDKIENYTQLKLPNGQYAYSAEWNPVNHQVVPLSYKTNSFCSGGTYLPDGRVVAIGGNADLSWLDPTVTQGFNAVRTLQRTADGKMDGQGWSEPTNRKLNTNRWYPTGQIMPDGRIFVASGSLNGLDPSKPGNNNPTWEMLDRNGFQTGSGSVTMDILSRNQPYYMYPFVHVLRDGHLFVAVAKQAQIFAVNGNKGSIVHEYDDIPGAYRTYPNTGTSLLLHLSSSNNYAPDIVICGGGPYQDIPAPSEASCARIQPYGTKQWEMDSMPEGRTMVEGILLPDGTAIFQNGAFQGAQGFQLVAGGKAALETLIYDPAQPLGKRFTVGPKSSIARLYHSATLLLLDGTIMIAGSNPVQMPVLKAEAGQNPPLDYVTEFRIETYTPPYLSGANQNKRPTGVSISKKSLNPADKFTITFTAPAGNKNVKVNLYHGGFVTHSNHMGQRSVFLDSTGFKAGATKQTITVTMPPNHNIVPPTTYVVYVLVDGVPAMGQFVQVL